MFGLFAADDATRLRRIVDRLPVVDPEEVSTGPTAVEGVVRRHREAVPEPLGDGETCVYARHQRRERGGRFSDGEVVESEEDVVPFVVESDEGRVLVDPREALDDDGPSAVLVSAGNTVRYYGDESGETLVEIDREDRPEPADDAGDAPDDDRTVGLAEAESRLGDTPEWVHVQSVIRPGDGVYVLGEADEVPGGSPPYVVRPDDDGVFLLSDMTRSAIVQQLEEMSGPIDRRFWGFVVVGLVLALAVILVVGTALDFVF